LSLRAERSEKWDWTGLYRCHHGDRRRWEFQHFKREHIGSLQHEAKQITIDALLAKLRDALDLELVEGLPERLFAECCRGLLLVAAI
jgi:hypothetical protein